MKRALLALGVVVVAVCGAAVARAIEYGGAAKPGVHVLGMDVGGESRGRIEARLRAWSRRPVTISAGDRSYTVARSWLVSLDVRATADHAVSAGSLGALVIARRTDASPVFRRTSGAGNVLGELAKAGREPVSATVRLAGTTVTTTPARDGRALDRSRLLQLLTTN